MVGEHHSEHTPLPAPDLPVGVAVVVGRGGLPTDFRAQRVLRGAQGGGLRGLLQMGGGGHLAEGLRLLAVSSRGPTAVGGGAVGVDGRSLLLLLVVAHGGAKVLVAVAEIIVLVGPLIKR